MKTVKLLLLLAASTLFIVACQKEVNFENANNGGNGGNGGGGGGNNKSIIGDWKFLGLTGKIDVSVSNNAGGLDVKVVTKGDIRTENNVGFVTFTSNQMKADGVGYTLLGTMDMEMYMAGMLLNTTSQPLNSPSPPTSTTSDYQKISNDSLYFPNNQLIGSPISGVSGNVPIGMRIQWSGDTLVLKATIAMDMNQDVQGIPSQIKGGGIYYMKLIKK